MARSKNALPTKTIKNIHPVLFVLFLFFMAVFGTTACNLPVTLASFVEKGMAFDEPPYTVIPDPREAPSLVNPNLPIEQLLAEVEYSLIKEQRNCNSEIDDFYYPCLQDAMKNGADANAALLECSKYTEGLEINDRGGMITISDQKFYYRDEDNFFGITYHSEGGKVEGVVTIAFDEGDPGSCNKQITYTFVGKYDPKLCSLSGSGTYISDYSGDYCIGAERSEYETPWQARIEDGYLSGFVENTAIDFSYDIR